MSDKPCPHGHTRRRKCYICDYEDEQEEQERLRQRIAELEAQLAEAQKDADRFKALQDMDPKKAQAFFWNYTSRKQRAKAIDEAMEKK